jgi:hypothetical protein
MSQNYFATWTPAMVAERNAKVLADRMRARGLIPVPSPEVHKSSQPEFTNVKNSQPLNVTKIEATKKKLLNKTESLWRDELKRRGHAIVLEQALTFRLGDRLQYRPDLITIEQFSKGVVEIVCYETKAPHRWANASLAKPKMAAKLYPFITFKIVMRNKSVWTEKEIRPE